MDYSNFSNITTNVTEAPGVQRDEDLAKIEIVFQGIIFFLAVFGNGLVLLILGLRKKKLNRMNILIVHLTVADLFVAFFNILPQLLWDITYRFHGNDFLCRSVKYLQVVAMYASAYVLVTTAVDRYLVICHPLTIQTWSTIKVHLLVLVAWILSLLFSLPQLVIFSYREVAPDVYDCWGEFEPMWTLKLYISWIAGAIYIIPALLLSVLYGNICLTVYRSLMSRESFRSSKGAYHKINKESPNKLSVHDCRATANPRAHVRVLSRSKVKTVKLTLTVVACYLLCWGPFFVAQMWAAWDDNAPFNNEGMVILLLMASLNSCTNPWVYMAFSDNLCLRLNRWQHRRQETSDTRLRMTILCSEGERSRYPSNASMPATPEILVNQAAVHSAPNGLLKKGRENTDIPLAVLKRQSMVRLGRETGCKVDAL